DLSLSCRPVFPYPTLFRSHLPRRHPLPAHVRPEVLPALGLRSALRSCLRRIFCRSPFLPSFHFLPLPVRRSLPRFTISSPRLPRSEGHTSELQSRFDLVCR